MERYLGTWEEPQRQSSEGPAQLLSENPCTSGDTLCKRSDVTTTPCFHGAEDSACSHQPGWELRSTRHRVRLQEALTWAAGEMNTSLSLPGKPGRHPPEGPNCFQVT